MCINKPAGLRSQPDRTGDECARSSVGAALGHLPWVTHRLDRRVTGCLLLARTQRAASRLGRFFSERRVTKHYLAVCELPASDGVVPGAYARLRSASGEALDYRVWGMAGLLMWKAVVGADSERGYVMYVASKN